MKRTFTAALAAALMATGSFSVVHADEPEPRVGDRGVDVQVEARKPVLSDDLNRQQARKSVARRASEIQGMTIQNESGKDLGTVRDVVVDAQSGKVKYVAVSYGGFLGLGAKLFAVPFEAFDHRPESQDREKVLLLNLSEDTLRNAPGFDSDNWPNMADEKFTSAVDSHYRSNRPIQEDRREGVNVDVGDVDVDVNVDREREVERTDQTRPAAGQNLEQTRHILQADDIIGMDVVNQANEDIGSINDLMVDMGTGEIRYAAISVGGLAGIGDSLHAVAWNKFQMKHDAEEDENQLVLNANPEMLEEARGFDQNNWPQHAGDLRQSRDANTTGPNLNPRVDGSNTGAGAQVDSDVND